MKYHWAIRLLHWVIGAAVLCMILAGFLMTHYMQAPAKYNVYFFHKATGVTILFFMIIRVVTRLFTKAPPMPQQLSCFEKLAAKSVHFALYFVVIATAASGYIMSCASGKAISWFGLFYVPFAVGQSKELAQDAHNMHEILPYILLILIVLHIAASLKHFIFDKINLLKRII
jgi:cytochrome b561